MNLREVFEDALRREREGLAFFQGKAEQMSHAAARQVFRDLAAEETGHVAFIEGILARMDQGSSVAPKLAEGFFAKRAEQEMLDQTVIEAMVPDLSVLRVAWLIEKDIAAFYEAQAAEAEGGAKDAFLSLAQWERGHEALFRSIHERVSAVYEGMPWGG